MLVYIGKYKNSEKLLSRFVGLFLPEKLQDKFYDFAINKPFLFNTFFKHKSVDSPNVVVKVHKWDTWSADWTLSNIIVPILENLKTDKQGVPYVDPQDVEESARASLENLEVDSDEYYLALEKNWDWVLNEMIWAMKQIRDNESDAPHRSLEKPFDYEAEKAYGARIERGTTLFGKYFRTLWT